MIAIITRLLSGLLSCTYARSFAPIVSLPHADNASYLYSSLGSLEAPGNGSPPKQLHVYGIVSSFNHPRRSRGTDWTATVNIIDESCPLVDNAISCNLFHPSRSGLPVPVMVGDIIRLHRVKVGDVGDCHCFVTLLLP